MMKKLAEMHREKEKKDQEVLKEYPEDFDEEKEQENNEYNIFSALEQKRKENLNDLLKICENQLESKKSDEKTEGFLNKIN